MQITLTVRHGEVSDTLKGYVRDEVEGLSKYFQRLVEANIFLNQEGHRRIAEVRVHTSNDTHFASSEDDDFRTAIDDTVAKLRRQLKRHKGKLNNHVPKEERERIYGQAPTPGEPATPDESVAPESWPRISTSEATARLENSGEEVLVFVDSVDGAVKIARQEGEEIQVEEADSFEIEES
ncbi:MAG: ribosome-associated translation inhibitor RaiA [Gemmatimonadota bacterium]|nr:ribosome-associated translation inhibitor RaiA [Gemmatimonadota bacterium]